jgi:hypothetical protein
MTKIGSEVEGERIVWSSQLRQHIGRVDVGENVSSVKVSVFSEIPGLGPKLAFQIEV